MQRAGQQAAKLGFELVIREESAGSPGERAPETKIPRAGGFKAADRFRGARPASEIPRK